MSEFPVKRFGGKGHIDIVGVARSMRVMRVCGIDPHDEEVGNMSL
jgi:hypothetical protein